MPRTEPSDQSENCLQPTRNASDGGLDLDRVAELVATGQMPVPPNLSVADRQRLLSQVGRRRHDRLVDFIARLIAADIVSARGP